MKRAILLFLLVNGAAFGKDAGGQAVTVEALAYRIVPQQTTTYYQTPGQAYTSCYGQGQDFGMFTNLRMSCNTTYTDPTQIPITWRFADVYNLVETPTQRLVIACRAGWRWSKCSWLRPGDVFGATLKGGTLEINAIRENGKTVKVKYRILQGKLMGR